MYKLIFCSVPEEGSVQGDAEDPAGGHSRAGRQEALTLLYKTSLLFLPCIFSSPIATALNTVFFILL